MFRVTVEPAVLLYAFSYVVQLSVIQDFIFSKLCKEQFSPQERDAGWQTGSVVDGVARVQADSVAYVMWLSVIASILSFFTAQFFGVALDRYSSKVVMTAPFMGFLAMHVVCVVVAAVPSLPLPVLYVGATLNGLSGGYPVFKSAVSSYVVKTVPAEERTFRLSVVEGMVFLGSAVGPLTLQQTVTSTTSPHDYLFLGSEAALAVALLYIVILLPDSPSSEKSSKILPGHSDNSLCAPVKTVLQEFSGSVYIVLRSRPGGRRTLILLLILADFFIATVFSAEFDLLYMYMHSRLGFNLAQYCLYLVVKNLVNGMSLLGILPVLRRVLNVSDTSLGILGGTSRVAAFTLLALNQSHNLVFLVPFLDVFGQYLFVVMRSSLCSFVYPEEQGRVLTVLSSLAQMSMLVGSLMFDNVYPAFMLAGHSGYTFLLAATSMAIATTIFVYIHYRQRTTVACEEARPLLR